jgi:hypothetical protein
LAEFISAKGDKRVEDTLRLRAFETTKMTLQLCDRFGNKLSSGRAHVQLIANGNSETVYGTVTDNDNGTYTFTLMLTNDGNYKLAVTVDQMDVKGSPFQVSVDAMAKAPYCSATGSGTKFAVAGAKAAFKVACCTEGGEAVDLVDTAHLSGSIGPGGAYDGDSVTVTKSGKAVGSYECSYTAPKSAGTWDLAVVLRHEHVRGSPFSVEVVASESEAGNCVASGDGLARADAFLPASFEIQTFDAFGNQRYEGGNTFTAKIVHSDASESVSCSVQDNKNGTYACRYTVVGHGLYSLSIHAGSTPAVAIKGSPFDVHVTGGVVAIGCTADGPGLQKGSVECDNEFVVAVRNQAREAVRFDASLMQISIQGSKGPGHEDIVANIDNSQSEQGNFKVSYRPTRFYQHLEVKIEVRGEHIPGSPFQVCAYDTCIIGNLLLARLQ